MKVDGIELPEEMDVIVRLRLTNLFFWEIITDIESIYSYSRDLAKRFPTKSYVLLAKRGDNDDIACWDRRFPGVIFVVNDFSTDGKEVISTYENFIEWYKFALSELIDNISEI